MTNIIKINKLSKHYGKLVAVNELDLSIEKGNVFGILGPNGSGKTTTLGMILDVTRSTSGSFEWFEGKYGKNARKKVGAIIESPIFYPYMSAYENLKIVAKIKKQNYSDIERVLKIVELWERRKSPFRTYSLGMKQRLAIAAALIGKPEALILDEPTNGLDPQGIVDIRELILKIAQEGVSIILASHLLDEVQRVCSHVLIMSKGNKLSSGKVDDILQDKKIMELKAEDNKKLELALSQIELVEHIKNDKDKIVIEVQQGIQASQINQLLINQGIILSHLLVQEKSLEKFFIDLLKNNHV